MLVFCDRSMNDIRESRLGLDNKLPHHKYRTIPNIFFAQTSQKGPLNTLQNPTQQPLADVMTIHNREA